MANISLRERATPCVVSDRFLSSARREKFFHSWVIFILGIFVEKPLDFWRYTSSMSMMVLYLHSLNLHYNRTQFFKLFRRNMVALKIFFPENSAKAYQRDELYSPEDLIANIGGTLGLCLGFSLVSIVELFYFLTLRWIFEGRKSKKF